MALDLDKSAKQQLLLSAASLAGPTASTGEINAQIDRLLSVVAPGGAHAKHLEHKIDHYDQTVTDTKTFVGTILNVDKEESSNRAVVFFHSPPNESKFYKPLEAVRTDITKDNPRAQALANEAVQLVGHKVVLSVRMENTKAGDKVRVLDSIEDRGLNTADALPEFSMEAWDAIPNSSPKSGKLVRGAQGVVLPLPQLQGA